MCVRTPQQRLKHWADTVRLTTPMRPHIKIPFLYQFDIRTLKEGLIQVTETQNQLAQECQTLTDMRNNQYPSPQPRRVAQAFRFIDELERGGTPNICDDPEISMVLICIGTRMRGDIRMFRSGVTDWKGMWKIGEMLRHTIEVIVRLIMYVRERIAAFRWALGVAQGDVDDARMVWWCAVERHR